MSPIELHSSGLSNTAAASCSSLAAMMVAATPNKKTAAKAMRIVPRAAVWYQRHIHLAVERGSSSCLLALCACGTSSCATLILSAGHASERAQC